MTKPKPKNFIRNPGKNWKHEERRKDPRWHRRNFLRGYSIKDLFHNQKHLALARKAAVRLEIDPNLPPNELKKAFEEYNKNGGLPSNHREQNIHNIRTEHKWSCYCSICKVQNGQPTKIKE